MQRPPICAAALMLGVLALLLCVVIGGFGTTWLCFQHRQPAEAAMGFEIYK